MNDAPPEAHSSRGDDPPDFESAKTDSKKFRDYYARYAAYRFFSMSCWALALAASWAFTWGATHVCLEMADRHMRSLEERTKDLQNVSITLLNSTLNCRQSVNAIPMLTQECISNDTLKELPGVISGARVEDKWFDKIYFFTLPIILFLASMHLTRIFLTVGLREVFDQNNDIDYKNAQDDENSILTQQSASNTDAIKSIVEIFSLTIKTLKDALK